MTVAGRRRLVAVACIAGLSAIASANGAMGLALEMFDYKPWLVYVAAMVGLEAWYIGVKNGRSPVSSIATATGANLLTAFCCPILITPALHVMNPNPNPIAYILQLLCGFGLVSAVLEGIVWSPRDPLFKKPWRENFLARSLVAHAMGVPIALAILLLPQRPYLGMEGSVQTWRYHLVLGRVLIKFTRDSLAGDPPKVSSLVDMIDKLGPDCRPPVSDTLVQSAWVAAYIPCFHRFDTGEEKRIPFEWNPLAGHQLSSRDTSGKVGGKSIWLIRSSADGRVFGYVVRSRDDTPMWTEDRAELGY